MGSNTIRGDYEPALEKVLAAVDYPALRAEQAARRADPNAEWLMGIGVVNFTEIVGAGPSKMCDILGVGMFDSCEIRVHPDGSAIARMGTITQGQGHQTTYAQIIATELGIPASVIPVEEGDTYTAPYGSAPMARARRRSRAPRSRAPRARSARRPGRSPRICSKRARTTSSGISTASCSRARPSQFKTMKEIAWAAYNNVPEGMEKGLDAVDYYDPPNFTFPFGAYVCVVDVNRYHRRDARCAASMRSTTAARGSIR